MDSGSAGQAAERRVEVVLPGGRVVTGRLLARQRDEDGRWWYRVAVDVPAVAVRPVDGEDYSEVPTSKGSARRQWVLEDSRHESPEGRILILHTAGCWAPQGRLTPVTDADQVQVFLRETWARPCDVCAPELPASR
ncbi:hypothetical protein P3T26_004301 [Streptomyces sp. MAA16]|nr:hypothetical protein [Streptomyces sp. MAA16]